MRLAFETGGVHSTVFLCLANVASSLWHSCRTVRGFKSQALPSYEAKQTLHHLHLRRIPSVREHLFATHVLSERTLPLLLEDIEP